MRVDSHVCFSESHPPEHLKAILERNRFDGAILVSSDLRALELPILGVVIRHGSPAPSTLDQYQKHPAFRGISRSLEVGIPDGLDELERRSIPLDVEMRPPGFPTLLRLAERHPSLRLVIEHLARPDFHQGITAEWAKGMESVARLPQVFCKISGLLTEVDRLPWSSAPMKPFVQHALAVFGAERLMFGSEWPVRLPDVTWKESLAVFTQSIGAQSMEVREQLLGGTACDFYGLPRSL